MKINVKNSQKTLDKCIVICYNVIKIREDDDQQNKQKGGKNGEQTNNI